ncbi:MAG: exodeoxyribonuclease VII large subunit, partial [Paracoccaceae bacterium]
WPVAVQGERCAPEVANAIRGFNALTPGGALPRPDLLIVARGGGSVEDLWGFNEEVVARAAAASDIPLISAVGHETDTTLIDFASDLRAPTPTAAAEHAVPVRSELMAWVQDRGARMARAQADRLAQRDQRLRDVGRLLPRPASLLDPARQRLDVAAERLPVALLRGVERRRLDHVRLSASLRPQVLAQMIGQRRARFDPVGARLVPALTRGLAAQGQALTQRAARLTSRPLVAQVERSRTDLARVSQRLADAMASGLASRTAPLEALGRLHETLGYRATLARGYAVVRSGTEVVTRKADAERAMGLEIEFSDGRLQLGGARKPRSKGAPPPEQGSLF